MTDNFSVAMGITAGHEGGWANNPADRGGETFRGIARKFHTDWPGWEKIDAAKGGDGVPQGVNGDTELKLLAESFYRANFWDSIHGDELPLPLAAAVFDMAVNFFPGRAIRTMQLVLGVEVDGKIGPKTIKAAHDAGPMAAINLITARLLAHHKEIVEHPDQAVFARNWLGRCVALAAAVARL